jgi:hypothetical protein
VAELAAQIREDINTARILDAIVLVVQTPTPVAGSRRATPISIIVSS